MVNRAQVPKILADHRKEIASFGVKSLYLFGSVARNEARPDSDVDLLVEFSRPVGLFTFIGLKQYPGALLGCPVDLGTPNSLKPRLKQRILEEAIHVTWRLARML